MQHNIHNIMSDLTASSPETPIDRRRLKSSFSPGSIAAKMQDGLSGFIFGKETITLKESFYACAANDMDGQSISMEAYKDQVCIVVNVASF